MSEQLPEINLDGVFENFYDHFSKDGNKRILFTAPFGMGKTYFLNRFFTDYLNEKQEEEGTEDRYQYIRVSPVNYVPSDNATIFELIKVDILLNLFLCGELDAKKVDLKSSYFDSTLALIKRKPEALVKLIANVLPLLSIDPATKLVLNGFKVGTNQVIDFLAELEKIKIEQDRDLKSEKSGGHEFIETMTLMKGTHLEFDLISQIIQNTIENSENKFVLVVDDLDRLDPGHIFRILNIFSAQENYDSTNKFGFDKVITVCDLDNLKNIFHHFYGQETKFNGYLAKFMSFSPYIFENFNNIHTFIEENNLIKELDEFNLVLALFTYTFIKIGKTDLRKTIAALNYNCNANEDILFDLKRDNWCYINEQPIFYMSAFLYQLMPFENFQDIKFPVPGNSIMPQKDSLKLNMLMKELCEIGGAIWVSSNSTEMDVLLPLINWQTRLVSSNANLIVNYSLKAREINGRRILYDVQYKSCHFEDGNLALDNPNNMVLHLMNEVFFKAKRVISRGFICNK